MQSEGIIIMIVQLDSTNQYNLTIIEKFIIIKIKATKIQLIRI